jgi:hypothetical protein
MLTECFCAVAFDKLDVASFAARTQSTLIAEARGEHEKVAVKQTSEVWALLECIFHEFVSRCTVMLRAEAESHVWLGGRGRVSTIGAYVWVEASQACKVATEEGPLSFETAFVLIFVSPYLRFWFVVAPALIRRWQRNSPNAAYAGFIITVFCIAAARGGIQFGVHMVQCARLWLHFLCVSPTSFCRRSWMCSGKCFSFSQRLVTAEIRSWWLISSSISWCDWLRLP